MLSLWSLDDAIYLVDPGSGSPSDCLSAGTSHLIQPQSPVMLSDSLKCLFAFFSIQPWTKPTQANAVHPISLFKKIFTYMAVLGLSCGPFDLCCGMSNL